MPVEPKIIGSNRLFHNSRFSVDDTLLYLGLIHGILGHCDRVVDVGCGRGQYADDSADAHNLFDLRGPERHVLGIDVDPAAAANPFLNEFKLIVPDEPWPTADNSADLIVCDWTLEHVQNPQAFFEEVRRTLHLGGVFIARSINYHSLLSRISRSVPNRRHSRVLSRAQPDRLEVDVFPAFYRMNTPKQLDLLMSSHFEYSLASRPGLENYLRARHPRLASVVAATERRVPESRQTAFVVCGRLLRK